MLLGSIQYYHSVIAQEQSSDANTTPSRQTMRISGVHLPKLPDYYLWDVEIGPNNTVESITPINYPPPSAPPPSLLLPSLCHPHIHLEQTISSDLALGPVRRSCSQRWLIWRSSQEHFFSQNALHRGRPATTWLTANHSVCPSWRDFHESICRD